MKTRLLIIIPIVITLAILAVIAYDSITLDTLCADDGGKRIGDICRIPIITNSTKDNSKINVNLSQVTTMKPNHMEFFYYPNTKNSEKPDPYQIFMLIRLPEWMGGDSNDASAFRAYSAKSLDDSCLVKYWGEYGRQRIENPCQGSMYRVVDGAMTIGLIPMSNMMTALPHLDLSNDENGFLYIEPPTWTKTENGVIGYGKELTYDDLRKGSAFLIESFAKSYPEFPAIHMDFAGYALSEISSEGERVEISYLDVSSKNNRILMSIQKCNCPEPNSSINLLISNSEFWQIGDTILKIGGSALNKNNEMPEQFKEYEIQFIKDGYEFRIEGKNIDFMKKEIVANYFPEYKFENLFLISKND
jgi:ubiquinol-cytochrome c reductase iron-sulfur subunit